MLRHRSVIHVEVTQRTKCNVDRGQLKTLVKNFVSTNSGIESLPVTLSGCDELKELHSYVERIQISTEGASMSSDSLLKVHIYKLNAEGNYYKKVGFYLSVKVFSPSPRNSLLTFLLIRNLSVYIGNYSVFCLKLKRPRRQDICC